MNADPRVMEHFPGLLTREESDAYVDRIDQPLDRGRPRAVGPGASRRRLVPRVHGPGPAPIRGCLHAGRRDRLAPGRRGLGPRLRDRGGASGAGIRVRGSRPRRDPVVHGPGQRPSRAVMERIGMTHDPADDFDHPNMPVGSPLRRHVLYRLSRDAVARGAASRSPDTRSERAGALSAAARTRSRASQGVGDLAAPGSGASTASTSRRSASCRAGGSTCWASSGNWTRPAPVPR